MRNTFTSKCKLINELIENSDISDFENNITNIENNIEKINNKLNKYTIEKLISNFLTDIVSSINSNKSTLNITYKAGILYLGFTFSVNTELAPDTLLQIGRLNWDLINSELQRITNDGELISQPPTEIGVTGLSAIGRILKSNGAINILTTRTIQNGGNIVLTCVYPI